MTKLVSPNKYYIPSNQQIGELIDYLEKKELINTKWKWDEIFGIQIKWNPYPKPKCENLKFKTWVDYKKKIKQLIENNNDLTNISIRFETSSKFNQIFSRNMEIEDPNPLNSIFIKIDDPNRGYGDGKKSEAGVAKFSIEIELGVIYTNYFDEENFFYNILRDKDFNRILKDFEKVLNTSLIYLFEEYEDDD